MYEALAAAAGAAEIPLVVVAVQAGRKMLSSE